MISKKVQAKSSTKGNLARLVDYLLDSKGRNDRVGHVTVTNCSSDDVKWAVTEMYAVQELNQRAKANKTYHLMVSFTSGELVAPETLKVIEARFCEALGFKDHQRISVVHNDTDNLHLHIAINKIHPERFIIHEAYNDYYVQEKLREELVAEFGLARDGLKSTREESAPAKTADMESLAGVETLIGYVKRNLKDPIIAAKSWNELHQAFGKAGVALILRGNGLVVEAHGQTAKASSCFRELSKSSLEKRFGMFTDLAGEPPSTPAKKYKAEPLQKNTSDLYEQYKKQREVAKAHQFDGLTAALDDHRERVASAKQQFKIQKMLIGCSRGPLNKTLLQLHLANLRRQTTASFVIYKEDKAKIYRSARQLVWNDWLIQQSEQGSQPALAALQARRSKVERETKVTLVGKPGMTKKDEVAELSAAYVTRGGTIRRMSSAVQRVFERAREWIDERGGRGE